MKHFKVKNSITGRNGFLELRDRSFFLLTTTPVTGKKKLKCIGKTERAARRWLQRSKWQVIRHKTEHLDIQKRTL